MHSSTSSENMCCVKGPTLCARDMSAEVMNQMHTLLVLPAVAAGLCPANFGDTLVFMGILRDSKKNIASSFKSGNMFSRKHPKSASGRCSSRPGNSNGLEVWLWFSNTANLAIPSLWETNIAGWNIPRFNKKYISIFKESVLLVLCYMLACWSVTRNIHFLLC